MEITIVKAVGKRCLIQTVGQRIYDQVLPVLEDNGTVTLDFAGVEMFASPFFNAAVGQLFKHFSKEDLEKRLHIKNLSETGLTVLQRVAENAAVYYKNKDYQKIVDELLAEQVSGA